MRRGLLASALVLELAACQSAPDAPTFRRDVKPIVDANCARCHGLIPRGGAPDTFRLDVYGDTDYDDGRRAVGVQLMSGFMATRAHAETMPPAVPLSGRQIEILDNYAEFGDLADPGIGDEELGNHLPELELTAPIDIDLDGLATVFYAISDDDFAIVTGDLVAVSTDGAEIAITRELYSGRSQTVWDTGVLEAGTYQVRARLDDGQGPITAVLGDVSVAHPGDNRAPVPQFCSAGGLVRDDLLTDTRLAAAPGQVLPIRVGVDDDGSQVSLELFAERGGESISLVAMTDVQTRACDDPVPLELPVTGEALAQLGAGYGWRLRLAVSDGTRSREARSPVFTVGHGDPGAAPAYCDLAPLFARACSGCHGAGLSPVGARFENFFGAEGKRGLIFRYVVQTQTMPPRSAELLIDGFAPVTAAERQLVADWLLAGAQPDARVDLDSGECQ